MAKIAPGKTQPSSVFSATSLDEDVIAAAIKPKLNIAAVSDWMSSELSVRYRLPNRLRVAGHGVLWNLRGALKSAGMLPRGQFQQRLNSDTRGGSGVLSPACWGIDGHVRVMGGQEGL